MDLKWFCHGICPIRQPRWVIWAFLTERAQGRRPRAHMQTWMPLSPPSQPSHPWLQWGIGPRHPIQSHGHCPAPLALGTSGLGCCQSPFHVYCSQRASLLSRAVSHGQILPHTEVQDCADGIASTASQSSPTGLLFPQTCHPYNIPTTKSSKDNAYSCRNTWEIDRDPVLVNMTSMQGELHSPWLAEHLLTKPTITTALPGTLVTFISNTGMAYRAPFLFSIAWKSPAKPQQSTRLQRDNYIITHCPMWGLVFQYRNYTSSTHQNIAFWCK